MLEAKSIEDVKMIMVEKELNELKYKSVKDWFAYLSKLINIGTSISDGQIKQLTEIKATRDIFTHNSGVVDHIYLKKTYGFSKWRENDHVEIDNTYFQESWQLFVDIVKSIEFAFVPHR